MSKINERDPIAALEKLKALLAIEKQADFEQFRQLILQLTPEQRIEKGVSWHPVQVLKTGYSIGDRAYVTVERTRHLDEPHQFRSGSVVSLFSLSPQARQPERGGVVQYLERNRMKIILNVNDLPDWIDDGDIGVNLMFDERTYLEMERALDEVMRARSGRLVELRNLLLGVGTPAFRPLVAPVRIESLNDSQNQAVNNILAAQDVAIVHGPPGTGKTTTIVQAIHQICQTEAQVLVCAPSNAAVDLLTERLAMVGLDVVRVGNISRVDELLLQHTLDGRMAAHPEMKHIKKVKKEAASLRRDASRFKRKFTFQDKQERRTLIDEARELDRWADQLEKRLVEQILYGANVLTSTLVGVSGKYIGDMKFTTLVIDEAAQALEPATWIPILRSKRVIFTGDPLQLPPTVKSIEAGKAGLGITLMEKNLAFHSAATWLLNTQYRMNELIMGFSNQQFYQNALRAAAEVRHRTLGLDEAPALNHPLEFIDTAGCSFDEKVNEEYQSRYNPEEFYLLREHLYLLKAALDVAQLPPPSIGIISPYREQVVFMNDTALEDGTLQEMGLNIQTIDGFQGQERDVIYISLVRSNAKGEIGFLADYRRMNVAMTRARKKLVVIGDSATLGSHDFYRNFIAYCEAKGAYRTAWEFMS